MFPIASLARIAASLTEHWSPRVVAELGDSYIKVAKLLGSRAWQSHPGEDKLFMVLKGHLRIEMGSGVADLVEGEMFVVPKGVRHSPVAEEECHILLMERKSTLHTGGGATDPARLLANPLQPA